MDCGEPEPLAQMLRVFKQRSLSIRVVSTGLPAALRDVHTQRAKEYM
jgi:hypothetical protein